MSMEQEVGRLAGVLEGLVVSVQEAHKKIDTLVAADERRKGERGAAMKMAAIAGGAAGAVLSFLASILKAKYLGGP